jgi:methylthioribose-1-phosphate isomerase
VALPGIVWDGGRLRLLDQRLLPRQAQYLEVEGYRGVVEAIRSMAVRGAPAIGVAAAYGIVLAAREAQVAPGQFWADLQAAADELASARPTAVNLCWAVERSLRVAELASNPEEAAMRLLVEAQRIHAEAEEADRRLAKYGARLIPEGAAVLTHCHTGALATGGYGTALGVIKEAWTQGRVRRVFATETRPLLQGARLTAWELLQEGIPVTLVVDSAAGLLMGRGLVSCVIVGADRIAANGDVANKIGTYTLAVLAREHGIPFYVAAPTSTVDLAAACGEQIPIEERDPAEVTTLSGVPTAPEGAAAWNPAFDMTPARYVAAIITEEGVLKPPYAEGLRRVKAANG